MSELKRIRIEATEFTPEISLNEDGNLCFCGVSRPEDVTTFYETPINWIKTFNDDYINKSEVKYKISQIHLVFKMTYFNSSSSKSILVFLSIIKQIEAKGIKIIIDWHYNEADDQMLEDGQDLSDAVEIPFKYIIDNDI